MKVQRLQAGKPCGHGSVCPASPFLIPADGFGAGLMGMPGWDFGGVQQCFAHMGLFDFLWLSPTLASLPERGYNAECSLPPGPGCWNTPPFPSITCPQARGMYPVPNPALNKSQSAPKIAAEWETGFQPGLTFPGYCLAASSQPRRKPTKHGSCVACYFCLTGIC